MIKNGPVKLLTIGAVIGVLGLTWVAASNLTLVMGLCCGIMAFLAFSRQPRLSLAVWLLAIAFIPYWVGADLLGYVPAASLVGMVILAANLSNGQWRLTGGDVAITVLIAVGFIGVAVADSNRGVWFSMLTQWLIAYLVGKTVVPAAGFRYSMKAVAIVFGLVGVLATVELAFAWHPFVDLAASNASYATWSPIQQRGGLGRSEWAMGHSIALGGVLALSIPFVLRAPIRGGWKTFLLLAVFSGIACTFSRAAIISAVLTLALTLFFMRGVKPGARMLMLIFVGVAAYVGIRVLVPVFEMASLETAGSSSYRVRMFEQLLPGLALVGRSQLALTGADGTVYYGTFRSIDSTFLAVGLSFGWLAALAIFVPFIVMAARLLRRKATTAEIALLGQLPLLFTVALITQYQMLLWFAAGVAVADAMRPARGVGGAFSSPPTGRFRYAGATAREPASETVMR